MTHQQVSTDVHNIDGRETVSFQLSDVPDYLRQTEFYSSLEDDGEDITLPKQVFKKVLNVSSPVDAFDLLSTMRFWGLEKVPCQLIAYVAKSSHQDLNDMLSNFTQELRVVEFLRLLNAEMHNIRPSSDRREFVNVDELCKLETTIENVVNVLVMQFKYERGQIWNERTAALVAETGWLDCLIFVHEMGCPWDASTCACAARNDVVDCLKYAHTHGCPWDAQTSRVALQCFNEECYVYARDNGCPCDATTCATAAQFGRLSDLQFAHENGCPWDATTCEAAAFSYTISCLKYAHEQGFPWSAQTCANAACLGNLTALTYAHEQGCPWDETTCRYAAASGELQALIYAHENGCPWDITTCVAAVRDKSSACLAYAHKHGCPWGREVVKEAAAHGSVECLRYALDNGCPGQEFACKSVGDSLECLKYLREEKMCPWGSRIADNFARLTSDNADCLRYCLEQGCAADAQTMRFASHSLLKLQVLHENGCPWNKHVLHKIASEGRLECLKYALENGCPGREDVVLAAAPHLPLLQYLHAQGCPLLPKAYQCVLQAVRPIECVRFLFETGCCPWPKDACTWFVQHRRMDCLKYAHMHGAPWGSATCAAAVYICTKANEQQRALDFLTYLHEGGCPWDVSTLLRAKQCNNDLCLQYALRELCPISCVRNGIRYVFKNTSELVRTRGCGTGGGEGKAGNKNKGGGKSSKTRRRRALRRRQARRRKSENGPKYLACQS